jgi:hypothetical protein
MTTPYTPAEQRAARVRVDAAALAETADILDRWPGMTDMWMAAAATSPAVWPASSSRSAAATARSRTRWPPSRCPSSPPSTGPPGTGGRADAARPPSPRSRSGGAVTGANPQVRLTPRLTHRVRSPRCYIYPEDQPGPGLPQMLDGAEVTPVDGKPPSLRSSR